MISLYSYQSFPTQIDPAPTTPSQIIVPHTYLVRHPHHHLILPSSLRSSSLSFSCKGPYMPQSMITGDSSACY